MSMAKERKVRKVRDYTVILEPDKRGGYVVSVPSLPGCVTQGETVEEALKMAKDAMEGYLVVLKEARQEIPEEKASPIIARVKASVC